ncbi:SusC/RagA family TonB-linked outer membrane protein [Algoriphagus sp. H41]|uniref:SusC/RagA family TonB-linked outer membrane protein n=1 Tax=Algoriphagus oliviformis TaxID=2811231 RepID=A0ABS3C012_9BACT|nr:SusC/RagA family TonB-linked outer membrane protein [Algoriphagus oliviformis]MBN7809530.1 SusC/RagA family TonB-linked outer membrane protein [Algoriphagus oliviformis]
MRKLLLLMFCLMPLGIAWAQGNTSTVTGVVFSESEGGTLPGATIVCKGTLRSAISDSDGEFTLELNPGRQVLVFSYVGFQTLELEIDVPLAEKLSVHLKVDELQMEGVDVVSTGYQELSKERATGSFAALDQRLVNRSVSTGILERLDNVTSGLVFNRDRGGSADISIRGTATIFSDTQPLIVIDNFPYDGPIESINPNDVEHITVLKDAAAASIWGARAGNGVIVITTKSGKRGQGLRVSFNSNLSMIEAQDPDYVPLISSPEMVEVERDMFNRGVYASRERSNSKPLLSPVVETLIALRDGHIDAEEAERQLDYHRGHSTRDDLAEYYYRPALKQQYSLGISGGGPQYNYRAAIGYDHNALGVVDNNDSRITLDLGNAWKAVNDRLEIGLGLYIVQGKADLKTQLPQGISSPYVRLADGAGNPNAIARQYRDTFTSQASADGLLDWKYYPLAERGNWTNTRESQDIRTNLSLTYEILPGLSVSGLYQYWTNNSTNWELNDVSMFYTRDLINTFTQREEDGLRLAVPMGAIADRTWTRAASHHFRTQFNYSKSWKDRHELVALGGFEAKRSDTEGGSGRFYGYDDELGISLPVDFANRYRRYHNNALATIPYGVGHSGLADRYISYYANASYTLDRKYLVSGSVRKDASNLFGVETNMKGVPLWSAGAAWIISEEAFYPLGWLPYLKFRATYGFNGNINRSVSAYTTAYYLAGSSNYLTGLPSLIILNPPNPELRWERIGIANFGMDFESKNARVSGSLEYYTKKGEDLIGDRPFPSSTGVSSFRGNFADTRTNGVDLQLRTSILDRGLKWSSGLLFSWVREVVTSYDVEGLPSDYTAYGLGGAGAFPPPLKGYPLHAIFSYPWAGLDPDTGDPLGISEGVPSKDYTRLVHFGEVDELVYHGSGRPTVFGSWMNNVSHKGFELSFNISYRLGYYVRKQPLVYNSLYSGGTIHGDYSRRWQNPGDETVTHVPSFPSGQVANRDTFYNRSSVNVEKGDNIRLQDIRLSYSVNSARVMGTPFRSLEIFGYANNLAILWKKSASYDDPDYQLSPAPRQFSLGVRAGF